MKYNDIAITKAAGYGSMKSLGSKPHPKKDCLDTRPCPSSPGAKVSGYAGVKSTGAPRKAVKRPS